MPAYKLYAAVCLLAALSLGAPSYPGSAAPDEEQKGNPFMGEQLTFKVQWDPPWYFFFLPKMEAGEAELKMMDGGEFKGRKVLKLSLKGRSSGTLAKLARMKIEDEFVFLTDPETYCTAAAFSKIREGKRKRQIDVEYMAEAQQLHIREVDEATAPPAVKKDLTKDKIPACVHDALSAIYIFRRLQLREKHVETFMLANDDKIREVRAVVEKKETIEGPFGRVAAWRVTPKALMGGLFKEGGQFTIWFSADDKKVPLQFEAKVKLGHILGYLKTAADGQGAKVYAPPAGKPVNP